jgi:nucleotide-binding universal stress UspA family protein
MSGGSAGPGPATVTGLLTQNRDRALDAGVRRAAAVAPRLIVDADPLSGPVAQAVADSGSGALAFAFEEAKYPAVQASHELAHGHPGRILAELSTRADLTVLGGRARNGAGHRGPSMVTHALLSHAHGPVVTVPSR